MRSINKTGERIGASFQKKGGQTATARMSPLQAHPERLRLRGEW
jgi:hypothetical protein